MPLSRSALTLRAVPAMCVAVLTLLSGCAAKEPEHADTTPQVSSAACPRLYTWAPGFLVVNVAAGSEVTLNPAVRDFPVFCSPAEADRQLVTLVSAGLLPRGDWVIYELDGGIELARQPAPGRLLLNRPARLASWLSDRELSARAVSACANKNATSDAGTGNTEP